MRVFFCGIAILFLGSDCFAQVNSRAEVVEIYSNVDNDSDSSLGGESGEDEYGDELYKITRVHQKVRVYVENLSEYPVHFALIIKSGATEEVVDLKNNLSKGSAILEYQVDEEGNPDASAFTSFRVEKRRAGPLSQAQATTLLTVREQDFLGGMGIEQHRPFTWHTHEGWSGGGTVFTKHVTAWWGLELEWPEEQEERFELMTWPVAIPSSAANLNDEIDYAMHPGDTTGAWVFSEVERASGSWGMRTVAVDFPIQRCMLLPAEEDGEVDESNEVFYGHAMFARIFHDLVDLYVDTHVTQVPQL